MLSIIKNYKATEVPAKQPDSKEATYKQFMKYIDYLGEYYSPAEKKKLGYQRIVKKETFKSLKPSQKLAILRALGFGRGEIQEFQENHAKERLKDVIRAYETYREKTNKAGVPYTEAEVHQMLKRLHFHETEIRIASNYVRQAREEEVCKLYEKYSQLITESELLKELKNFKFTDAEIALAKNKSLAKRPVPSPRISSIGQAIFNFFFFVGKVVLFLIASTALLIGMALLALFAWPSITS